MSYEKLRYPLFWFSATISFAAVVFCSAMLTRTIVSMGVFNPVALIQFLCVAVNVYFLNKTPAQYRRMKQADTTIGLLNELIAELDKIEAERQAKLKAIQNSNANNSEL